MSFYALDASRRHPVVTAAVASLAAVVMVNAVHQGAPWRAVVYFAVLAASVAAIDLVLGRRFVAGPVPVVRSAGQEIVFIAIAYAIGFGWLFGRFVLNRQPPPGLLRLAWLVVLIAFVYQAALPLLFLARHYRLRDLGMRASGLQATPLVMLFFAGTALTLTPDHVTWKGILEESGGSIGGIVVTALLAAVPEEFLRFVWQTRVGPLLKSPAVGWHVASVVWAALHAPKDFDESHALGSTVMGVVNIVPLGLLWGYLTYRTRSIFPSILLHATNVWGLQNLL